MIAQGREYRLFNVLGFPVFADMGAAVMVVLIVLLSAEGGGAHAVFGAFLVALVAMASILAHELGHAAAVRRLGYGRSSILLSMMGGVCRWRGAPTPRDRVIIALAGPAVSLAIGVGALLIVSVVGRPPAELWILAWVVGALISLNIAWGIFNLLPIYPMDGGQATRALLGMRMPWFRATRTSLIISMVTGVLAVVWAVWAGWIFATVFIAMMLVQNWNELQQTSR
jgi:Zn-dependent protease